MQRICLTVISRTLALLALMAALLPGGCAHDANSGLDIETYPNEVNMVWSVRGNQFSENFWYYTVFNFSQAPSTASEVRPIDEISNELRGLNWELYVGFHPDSGSTQLITKQMPRGPTVIGTADGPTCTSTFDADGNGFGDIVVTCAEGGVTQIIRSIAVQENLLEPIYFRPIQTINNGIRPFRCHDYDFDADGNRDVAVLDAGNGGTAPFIRVLQGNGNAEFTALTDQPLGIDSLIDSFMDEFNNDLIDDIALLGESGGVTQVSILFGNADGTFTAAAPITVGDTAVSLQSGQIVQGSDNLAVAERGTSFDGLVRVLDVAIDGSLTERQQLTVPGACFSADIGDGYFNNEGVVACWQNADGTGSAGVWLSDGLGVLEDEPVSFSTGNNVPSYCISHETGNNNDTDIVLATGDPENLDQSLFIQEGGDFVPDPTMLTSEFAWVNDLITYITGLQPTRIEVGDVDNLGVQELILPHSSLEEGGNSISIFYGLGKNNYTTAERYWTDTLPEFLGTNEWLVDSQISGNQFQMIIDPNVFYDQAEQRPDSFVVQFFTCNRGINLIDNEDQQGIVLDQLVTPIAVPMEVDFFVDEQINPQANTDVYSEADADINNYQISVN